MTVKFTEYVIKLDKNRTITEKYWIKDENYESPPYFLSYWKFEIDLDVQTP